MKPGHLAPFFGALEDWVEGRNNLAPASDLYSVHPKSLPRILTLIGAADINNYPVEGLTTQDIINMLLMYQIGLLHIVIAGHTPTSTPPTFAHE